jgi:uncharacterized protein YigE (DUF2233 family)
LIHGKSIGSVPLHRMKNLRCFFLVSLLFMICITQTRGQNAFENRGLIRKIVFEGKHYVVCEADPRRYKIEVFNQLEKGAGFYTFNELAKQKGKNLIFAMNAGMYEKDLTPVGLFVSKAKILKQINVNDGSGNFFLKPNGVFLLDYNDVAHVMTTVNSESKYPTSKEATQSGPMLVIDGVINSVFGEHSTNLNIRNAIGANKKHHVVLVISEEPVNFYELARLFKENLECDNALYMDGFVSQYFAPELQKTPQPGITLGTFVAVSRK